MEEWLATLGASATAYKAAPLLLEKISKALGVLTEPWQIERRGRAETKVAIEKAKADAEGKIQAIELYERAGYRAMGEQMKHQANIENVTLKALPDLNEDADPSKMDEDWVTSFFSKSRLISNPEMQSLWAKILAGEANSPGAFSKKSLSILSDVEKRDADLFTSLCCFQITGSDGPLAVIYDLNDPIYKSNNVTYTGVRHLESLGLVAYSDLGLRTMGLPKTVRVDYFDVRIKLTFAADQNNELELGKVILTQPGKEFAPLSGATKVTDFLPYLMQRWHDFSPTIVSSPNPHP